MSVWSDERVAELRKLWADGKSASQIAAILRVTRNSVLGKVHRLGLEKGKSCGIVPKRVGRPRKDQANRPPHHFNFVPKTRSLFGAETPPREKIEEVVVPIEERRTLRDLKDDQCRWPIGDPLDPEFHFCNGTRVIGLPYCETHCRRAYEPPATREQKKNGVSVQRELVALK